MHSLLEVAPGPGPGPGQGGAARKADPLGVGVARVRRWPSPTIPVVISSLYGAESRRGILAGVRMLENHTCVRFVPASWEGQPHVLITPGQGGCNAVPGYKTVPGYVSVVHLHPPDCLTRVGHVVHELMHVLGFYHEHQRLDRDEHITVHYDNIQKGHEANFQRVYEETLGLPYDAASVMHYGPRGFCQDCSRPTITAHPGERGTHLMGQRANISWTDVARINRLYGCRDHYQGHDLPGVRPLDQDQVPDPAPAPAPQL